MPKIDHTKYTNKNDKMGKRNRGDDNMANFQKFKAKKNGAKVDKDSKSKRK